MKSLFTLSFLICLALAASAQTPPKVYTINADSTLLTGCDSNELIIENHTQAVPGFLWNTGRGRTIFKRPLTKISDTFYLVGADTLKLRNPNAWLQGGNAFGQTGVFGTKDNHHIDFYTNSTFAGRLDTAGNFLLGTTVSGAYKLDVVGQARVDGFQLRVSQNDGYDIRLIPDLGFFSDGSVSASGIIWGSGVASIAVNKSATASIPAGSLVIGSVTPTAMTAIADLAQNPIFVATGAGAATINGGYSGVVNTGTNGTNTNAYPFVINGCRGTGNGATGDIVFATGDTAASGTTVHPMTPRWVIKGGSGFLTNNAGPTSKIDISGTTGYSQFRLRTTYTPTSTSDTNGNVGDFSWDGSYFYIKTADGWKRSALTTF